MKRKIENQFFDINKLPAKEGIIVFAISMSRISNSQDAKKCFVYLDKLLIPKIAKAPVGLNIIYGDYLYLNSDEKASKLKDKFISLITSHKNSFLNLLDSNPWYIKKAMTFTTWNQQLLNTKSYLEYLGKLKNIYKEDKFFQKYIKEDFKLSKKKKLDTNQINFFLEEILLFYLVLKGKSKLQNDFIEGHEKWILYCYPGKPLKSEIYLHKKNFFNLDNSKNKYENSFYDLEKKKLYDYDNINLETLEL